MIHIKAIDSEHKQDLALANEPFPLFGRLIPSYQEGKWSWQADYLPEDQKSEMTFPQENYDYEAMKDQYFFLGAYQGDQCIGLAILQRAWFKYLYLYDLKVSQAYRGQGVGKALIEGALQLALEEGYRGLYTQGQDNNLAACLFYLQVGFEIGGLDTHVYKGTKQEGKADVLFYLDAK